MKFSKLKTENVSLYLANRKQTVENNKKMSLTHRLTYSKILLALRTDLKDNERIGRFFNYVRFTLYTGCIKSCSFSKLHTWCTN